MPILLVEVPNALNRIVAPLRAFILIQLARRRCVERRRFVFFRKERVYKEELEVQHDSTKTGRREKGIEKSVM